MTIDFFNGIGPIVCTGCRSQEISLHVAGSRSYVSGLLIDTRVVGLAGVMERVFADIDANRHQCINCFLRQATSPNLQVKQTN